MFVVCMLIHHASGNPDLELPLYKAWDMVQGKRKSEIVNSFEEEKEREKIDKSVSCYSKLKGILSSV